MARQVTPGGLNPVGVAYVFLECAEKSFGFGQQITDASRQDELDVGMYFALLP
jgi:hypothetical protein